MDRFEAMQVFARVVEAGSFTRAADTLQMNKTRVTQVVQQLEARLRVRLFNRTTRQVQVTADGAVYYERVLRLLAEVDEAEASLSSAQASPRGRLRVDVPNPLGRLLLVPALPAFHARYPDIEIDLGVSDRPVDLIGEHVDCVLRGGEITDPSLRARLLGKLHYGVCAAPAYLQQAGTPEHPAELATGAHRLVGFNSPRSGKALPFVLEREGERVTVSGRQQLAVNDGGALLAAGLAGLGVVRLPQYMLAPHLARGELLPLFAGWRLPAQPLYLAFTPQRHVSAKLRVFIDWVAELMAQQLAPPVSRSPAPPPSSPPAARE